MGDYEEDEDGYFTEESELEFLRDVIKGAMRLHPGKVYCRYYESQDLYYWDMKDIDDEA